ncbi:hypothetical protein M422DRAFT_260662 [Sphaerobolus stellatus SS14]|uniref:Uncharacterized protein n=1 Tax=Sphaerobolus stellatus (strain SS14) TaxID=990650 RepID=A0A0C9VHJ4_SPHS4|nr:hypothetical protein M422DRAFT_260662 [Sphaerobolus stellatus SS14]
MSRIPVSFWKVGSSWGAVLRRDLVSYKSELQRNVLADDSTLLGPKDSRWDSFLFNAVILSAPGQSSKGWKSTHLSNDSNRYMDSNQSKSWDVSMDVAHRDEFDEEEFMTQQNTQAPWPNTICRDLLAITAHEAISGPGDLVPKSRILSALVTAQEKCDKAKSEDPETKYPQPAMVPVRLRSSSYLV